jgi:hypothetical protein
MSRRVAIVLSLNLVLVTGVFSTLVAQQAGAEKGAPKAKGAAPAKQTPARPPVFFKEAWKANPNGGEEKLSQANVSNPDLELKLYGNTGEGILMTGFDDQDQNPTHTWSGVCETGCMFSFRHKTMLADLTGQTRLRVNVKTSGFHKIHPAVKTADGVWMVAETEIGTPADWLITETAFSEMKWLRLNPAKVTTTGNWIANPDLSSIDEIGFADLTPGSGHGPGGWADVAQIEVYAKSKPRP